METCDRRQQEKCLKPSDLSKKAFLQVFLDVCQARGSRHTIQKIIVVEEPHKRYEPGSDKRERHQHLAFLCNAHFVHCSVRKDLATKHGIHAFFTFNRSGFAAYVSYLLTEGPRKPGQDLDGDALFWPRSFTREKAMALTVARPQDAAQKKNKGKVTPAPAAEKRRTRLSFSEFTDFVVERNIQTVSRLWQAAKTEKLQGNVLVWNHVGSLPNAEKELHKVLAAWQPASQSSTLFTQSRYAVSAFSIPDGMKEWLKHETKTKALVVQGDGGLGKTEMVMACLVELCSAVHFLNKMDALKKVRLLPHQAVVLDDISMARLEIDDVKAWFDLEKPRDCAGRHEDGFLPEGVVRVFTTNHKPGQFFPVEYFQDDAHRIAVDRRHRWLHVVEDLRRVDAAPSGPSASAPVEPDIPSLPLAEFPEDDDAGLRDFFV